MENNTVLRYSVSDRLIGLTRDPGFRLMAYALLRDAFFISLVALGCLFTVESLLPRFASSRINLAVLITISLALAVLLILSGPRLRIATVGQPRARRWFTLAIILWAIALMVNSLLAFPWWATITILILTVTLVISGLSLLKR